MHGLCMLHMRSKPNSTEAQCRLLWLQGLLASCVAELCLQCAGRLQEGPQSQPCWQEQALVGAAIMGGETARAESF